MNLVALNGNIATDIELREAGKTVVTNINLAVRDDFKKDTTHFVKVEAWDKTAQLLNEYCSKGSKIGVTGSLKVDKFQDKEGKNREITKVNASRVEFLGSKNQNNSQGQTDQQPKNDSYTQAYGSQTHGRNTQQQKPSYVENPFKEDGPVDVGDDDLPF